VATRQSGNRIWKYFTAKAAKGRKDNSKTGFFLAFLALLSEAGGKKMILFMGAS
jgi:hypothetical protein